MILEMIIKNVFARPIRTLLTLLSVIIGVTAVILIDSVSSTGTAVIADELNGLGIDCISVMSEDSDEFTLDNADMDMLRQMDGVKAVCGIVSEGGIVSCGDKKGRLIFWGISDAENHLLSAETVCGSFLTEDQINNSEYKCVIGVDTVGKYFDCTPEQAIGKKITATIGSKKRQLEIVGIAAKESGIISQVVNEFVPEIIYLPSGTVQSMTDSTSLSQISVILNDTDTDSTNNAMLNIKRTFSEKHGTDAVKVENLTENKNSIINILSTVKALLTAIAGISVVVASIGITNIMFMSVTERKREIGIKKAIGATRLQIGTEFLIEGMTVSVTGCVMGILLSFGLTALIRTYLTDFSVTVSPSTVLLALSASMLVGALFSAVPSMKAAGEKPIDCLKNI